MDAPSYIDQEDHAERRAMSEGKCRVADLDASLGCLDCARVGVLLWLPNLADAVVRSGAWLFGIRFGADSLARTAARGASLASTILLAIVAAAFGFFTTGLLVVPSGRSN